MNYCVEFVIQQRQLARYVLQTTDVVSVAERLSQIFNMAFERRDSAFWGEYCLIRAALNEADVRISSNRDPMYQPGIDPPEDALFEPQFDERAVLIDIEHTSDEKLDATLCSAFPAIVRLK